MGTPLARLILGLVLLAVTSAPVDAQEPLSASLMRRLAAAADGYRTGDSVYVVAAYRFPHNVLGVFDSQRAADVVRDSAGTGYGRFGPFVTAADFELPTFVQIKHCRPSLICERLLAVPERDVDSVAVVVYRRSGEPFRSVSRGLEVDAVFFTLQAFDVFAVPHYTMLYGPRRVTVMRDSVVALVRASGLR
jgi:hypothetical protein